MGFSGISLRDDGLAIDPRMPPAWGEVSFRVQWHGRCVHVAIDAAAKRLTLTLETGDTMRVYIGSVAHALTAMTPISKTFV